MKKGDPLRDLVLFVTGMIWSTIILMIAYAVRAGR